VPIQLTENGELMKKVIGPGALLAALVAAGIWSAQPAHADCTTTLCDQQFIAKMDSEGISGLYNGAGRQACAELEAGKSYAQAVLDTELGNHQLDHVQAQDLVTWAQRIYCP
jgi:hydroxyethylthiazole kinase-like sugar kinase family protein